MSAGQHTAGPWAVEEGALKGGHILITAPANLYAIAKVYDQELGSEATNAANARLIAVAPDLVSELAASTAEMMGVVARLEAAGLGNLVGGVARQCDMNRAAIARATGAA